MAPCHTDEEEFLLMNAISGMNLDDSTRNAADVGTASGIVFAATYLAQKAAELPTPKMNKVYDSGFKLQQAVTQFQNSTAAEITVPQIFDAIDNTLVRETVDLTGIIHAQCTFEAGSSPPSNAADFLTTMRLWSWLSMCGKMVAIIKHHGTSRICYISQSTVQNPQASAEIEAGERLTVIEPLSESTSDLHGSLREYLTELIAESTDDVEVTIMYNREGSYLASKGLVENKQWFGILASNQNLQNLTGNHVHNNKLSTSERQAALGKQKRETAARATHSQPTRSEKKAQKVVQTANEKVQAQKDARAAQKLRETVLPFTQPITPVVVDGQATMESVIRLLDTCGFKAVYTKGYVVGSTDIYPFPDHHSWIFKTRVENAVIVAGGPRGVQDGKFHGKQFLGDMFNVVVVNGRYLLAMNADLTMRIDGSKLKKDATHRLTNLTSNMEVYSNVKKVDQLKNRFIDDMDEIFKSEHHQADIQVVVNLTIDRKVYPQFAGLDGVFKAEERKRKQSSVNEAPDAGRTPDSDYQPPRR